MYDFLFIRARMSKTSKQYNFHIFSYLYVLWHAYWNGTLILTTGLEYIFPSTSVYQGIPCAVDEQAQLMVRCTGGSRSG